MTLSTNCMSYSLFANEENDTILSKTKKTSMVLRSHNPVKKTGLIKRISRFLPINHNNYSDLFSPHNAGVIKKKTRQAKMPIAKMPPENSYMLYCKKITQNCITPDNSFNKTPSTFRRRSKRLSNISSSSTKKISFDSAIKKLVANSCKLHQVIEHDENKNQDIFRFKKTDRSSQAPLKLKNMNLRNAKTDLKRRLSTHFKKYSNLEDDYVMSGRSSKRLCGKYNQAHYFDG